MEHRIRVYNTLTQTKEPLVPLDGSSFGIYACGPTVYSSAHLGHARAAVTFDIIVRFLKHMGYGVTYVRNFTDIDDKIIERAAESGIPADELARGFIDEYRADMEALGVDTPDHEPKVSDHLPDIIALIETLIAKGYAYASGGDVFYSIKKFPRYGRLARRNIEDLREGVRIEIHEQKEDPLDFALWKAAKPGEPSWESPWGPGRPGWHIECSAMSMKYLGESFDIHGGGKDLVFPHHENEIAQSEGATGAPFARYWLHNGMIEINREKMSKSRGNILNVGEALEMWDREVIRFLFLTHHYQNPAEFSDHTMDEAKAGLTRLYTALERVEKMKTETTAEDPELAATVGMFRERWDGVMCDDFNTAGALGVLFDLVKSMNRSLDSKGYTLTLEHAVGEIHALGDVLGILTHSPAQYLRDQGLAKGTARISTGEIDGLIEERARAREEKDWARADEIRRLLTEKGVAIDDTPQGTTWRFEG